mgnify:CR=1 FL=1
MSINGGKYEPNVVKETIQGKEVRCNICGVDSDSVCLEVGEDFIFKILTASFAIDEDGYFWELVVVNISPNTPILDITKIKDSVIKDLGVIDNFYEQLV